MDFNDCIQFIAESKACTLCTVDGNRPRGRGMVPLWVKEDGVYFTTAATKDLYKQLCANPNVELCFISMDPLKHLRMTGRAVFIEDPVLRNQALEERPFLKALGMTSADNPSFILFKIGNGEAHFWSWGDNLKEKDIPRITF